VTGLRAHLTAHFSAGEPDGASVTFLGLPPIEILRFGPDPEGVTHYVSVGGSRHADGTPAEVVVSLRSGVHLPGLARSVAVVAAAPAVEGLVLSPAALVDLGQPLWEGAPFTAVLLSASEIEAISGVEFMAATPVTPTEAAWVRLKGVDAMRQAWRDDGVDVLDPNRPAAQPR
jgi:hypothetical protein